MIRIYLLTIILLMAVSGYSQDNIIIAKGEKVTKAGGGYAFTEGPAVAPDGRVFFTDQPNEKIDVWSENGTITTFLHPCERSNGMYFNKKGELVTCADLYNRIV